MGAYELSHFPDISLVSIAFWSFSYAKGVGGSNFSITTSGYKRAFLVFLFFTQNQNTPFMKELERVTIKHQEDSINNLKVMISFFGLQEGLNQRSCWIHMKNM